jgi:uncharacterized protein
MGRLLLIIAGTLCVALAVLGIFVPLLPTTPFLLLAAACYTRSSDRLYKWLVNQGWVGTYIRNYREHRAITVSGKILATLLLWSTIIYTMLLVAHHWALRALLITVAVSVTIHLLRLKTATSEMVEAEVPENCESCPPSPSSPTL